MGMFANALSGQSHRTKKPAKLYMMVVFGVLIAISALLWAISPGTRWIGEVMFAAACLGGLGVYVYGKLQRRSETSVIQKYGLK